LYCGKGQHLQLRQQRQVQQHALENLALAVEQMISPAREQYLLFLVAEEMISPVREQHLLFLVAEEMTSRVREQHLSVLAAAGTQILYQAVVLERSLQPLAFSSQECHFAVARLFACCSNFSLDRLLPNFEARLGLVPHSLQWVYF
jgi:hypothetical protein